MKKMKRTMVYILTVVLLLTSLTGCDDYHDRVGEVFNAVKEIFAGDPVVSEKAEAPDETEAPEETEEPEETEAPKEQKPSESDGNETLDPESYLEYTLSEEDIAVFETQLLLCEEMLKNGASYEDMELEADTLDELTYGIQNQASIANVLYYCDLEDEEAVENYLFSSEVSTEVTSEYLNFLIELYDSGSYEEYFADFLDIEIQYMESYSDETTELVIRNSEILAEFHDLQEDEFEDKLGPLYSEFVNNCNTIAQKNGYDSYYEYISTFGYMRDYGQEEREQFREYVKEYIVPIYYEAYVWYEDAYNELSREEKKLVSALLYNEFDSLETDYIKDYLAILPENCQNGMQHMFENEAFIVTDYKDAYEGAFTTDIGVPFCYFGPGYQDSFTMIHEIGHYYAENSINTSWLSYDLCETQSQGNELLFLGYLGTVLDPDVFEALETFKLSYYFDTIVQATLMDEFEDIIYHLPDEVDYTTEDFDKIMHQVMKEYGIPEGDEYTLACMEWIWRNVGIGSPVYYLSYATSAMASLSIYSQSLEDYDKAVESYRIIQEEVDMDRSFKGTLEKAGIASVFEEDAYIMLSENLWK